MRSIPNAQSSADSIKFRHVLVRSVLSVALAILAPFPNHVPLLLSQNERQAAPPALKVEILRGQSAMNNIRTRKAVEPVVVVKDEQGQPISGVMVMFTLPETGPGGSLADGSKRAIAYSDSEGKATMRGLAPNATPGKFQIVVNASFHGLTAGTSIEQTNYLSEGGKGSSSKLIAILAIAGGAAVAGVVAAGGGGSGSSQSLAPSPGRTATTITPGTPVFGAPQ